MLSERTRNITVGLTMLVALGVLMYGIVLLGKFPSLGTGYLITLIAPSANGITAGSSVQINGVGAGQVKSVWLSPDADGRMVANVVIQIDNGYDLPESTVAMLSRPAAVGNPFVEIQITDTKGPKLPHDGKAVLQARVGESGLIPKEVFEDLRRVSNQLGEVAKDLHILLVYAPPEAIEAANPNDPDRVRENASTVIVRLNRLVKNIQDLLGDPAVQGKVRDAIQNIADASVQLKKTLEKIDSLADKTSGAMGAIGVAATQAGTTLVAAKTEISRVAQSLVEALGDVQKLSRQVREGNGTTGRMINDPRLYESLLDLSKSLQKAVDDLDFMVTKWKDEGVKMHFK